MRTGTADARASLLTAQYIVQYATEHRCRVLDNLRGPIGDMTIRAHQDGTCAAHAVERTEVRLRHKVTVLGNAIGVNRGHRLCLWISCRVDPSLPRRPRKKHEDPIEQCDRGYARRASHRPEVRRAIARLSVRDVVDNGIVDLRNG